MSTIHIKDKVSVVVFLGGVVVLTSRCGLLGGFRQQTAGCWRPAGGGRFFRHMVWPLQNDRTKIGRIGEGIGQSNFDT